jgi:hypothetical protein
VRIKDPPRAAALVVAAGCALAGVTLVSTALADSVEPPPRAVARAVWSPVVPVGAVAPPTTSVTPVSIGLPTIGTGAQIVELGRNADGTVEVPVEPLQTGWYRYSPTPGALGPAVILGHVDDDRTGPAVFYRLAELAPGDPIHITRSDGSTVTFAVDEVREVPKDPFPTADVYGNTDHAALRLISCANWDHDARTYRSNTVVFAHLTGTT